MVRDYQCWCIFNFN